MQEKFCSILTCKLLLCTRVDEPHSHSLDPLDGNEAKFYKHKKKKKNMLTPFSHFEFLWLETCKPGLSCPSSEGKPAQVLWRLSGRRSLDGRARNYLRCLQRLVLPWLP